MKKRKKKGFTLIELLAVVVILGIVMVFAIPAVSRWISRGKAESDEGNKKTLVMAAQSYAQGNSEVLPKVVGGSSIVTAEELKDANYLKEELKNSDKKSCMDSYVQIVKTSKGQYKYTAYIYCEGDTIIADTTVDNPIISIFFYGNKNENEQVDDVKISAFRITIEGGGNLEKRYTLASYSYSISARYTGNSNDKLVEIFNSGNIEAGQQERIIIEKSLSEYTDITKVNDFVITVEAYNSVGAYRKQSATSSYKDSVPPKCGKVTGEPKENEWSTTRGHVRTISVLCDDGDGSGCIKSEYTKSFDTEMEFGYITISDNAGNTTDCKVRVNHDWTRPTLIITAYKINADGSRGKKESDPVTANEINSAVTIYNYYDAVNGWLNLSLFPKGIEYVVTTSDNVKLNQGRWYENNAGIYNLSASNLENYMAGTPTNFTTTNNTASMKFTQAGLRRGKYTLTDAAGNSVLIKVKADIDHTIPKCKTTKSHTGHTDGVHATVYCTDGQSGCVKSEETHTGVKRTTSYTVKDKAGNESSPCEITVTARDCNCSNCYYGENTCKYGCSTCSAFTYESTCSGYGSGCTAKVTNWGTDCSCPCNCSSCHTGHNTCRYGCDTCYH